METKLQFERSWLAGQGNIAGLSVAATLDTGATTSFVTEGFAEKIQGGNRLMPHQANIQVADESCPSAGIPRNKCQNRRSFDTRLPFRPKITNDKTFKLR